MSHKFVPGQYIKNTFLNEYGIIKSRLPRICQDDILHMEDWQTWFAHACIPNDNPNLDMYWRKKKLEFEVWDEVINKEWRVYVNNKCSNVEISFQDDERTLKIFLT